MTPAIELTGVKKTYRLGLLGGKHVHALAGIDLSVAPGEVFGLVGPNGAGKSTAIKILLNLVMPSAGEARLFGIKVSDPKSREGLGYVPENPVPYEYLSGYEYVSFQAQLAGLPSRGRDKVVADALERVGMGQHGRLLIRRYSKGMVQRTMLAGALLGKPRVVILDEPTSGLDPLGRKLVRDLIIEQRKAGVAVLFCTHIISDVESLCDRVALLVGGSVRRAGGISELVNGTSRTHEIIVEDTDTEPLKQALQAQLEDFETIGRRAIFQVRDDRLQEVLALLVSRKERITRVQPIQTSLEETLVKAVQESGSSVGGALE